jgi:hypothetical protein
MTLGMEPCLRTIFWWWLWHWLEVLEPTALLITTLIFICLRSSKGSSKRYWLARRNFRYLRF